MGTGLFALLIPMLSLAADGDCTEVRLDKSSLRAVPIFDQSGVDNCYAFAAAAAADAWRFSHGDKRLYHVTSPTHLSVLFAYEEKLLPLEILKDIELDPDLERKLGRVNLNRGSPTMAFEKLRRYGSCDSRGFLSHRDQLLIEAIWLHLKKITSLADSEGRRLNDEEIQCFREGLSPFKNASWLVYAFSQAMAKKYPLEIMKDAATRICRFRSLRMWHLPKPLGEGLPQDRPEDRLKLIHAALDQSLPQPAVVSYCSRVLSDKNAKATAEPLGKGARPCTDRPKKYDGHVSAVVGRRKAENGKCQFLVRNSWGMACKDRPTQKPYAWDCEVGQIWVDEDALANNSYWVSYLPAKPKPAVE